jgi:hypothetical protein
MEKRGDPIPGSIFFRSFCDTCGEPIRVSKERAMIDQKCSTCRAAEHPGYNVGDGMREPSPWSENAVRHLEDG